jgi:sugar phosphate isomerase/epimerase
MKLSVVVPALETGKLSDFEEDVIKVSELGYDAIELDIRDPEQIDRKTLAEIISVQGLAVSSILTGRVFSVDRLSLSHPDKKVRKLAIRRIQNHISFAAALSAIVLIGWVRGNWKRNKERARKSFVNALRECGKFAENEGVLLGIEPINRYEIDSIQTIDEAVGILKETGFPNIGIVADTFHMNIEEDEPIYKSIRKCKDHLFHVHVADNNRKVPGAGHLMFRRFFKALREIGYDRFVSVEIVSYLPKFETVAEKSIRYLRKIM